MFLIFERKRAFAVKRLCNYMIFSELLERDYLPTDNKLLQDNDMIPFKQFIEENNIKIKIYEQYTMHTNNGNYYVSSGPNEPRLFTMDYNIYVELSEEYYTFIRLANKDFPFKRL